MKLNFNLLLLLTLLFTCTARAQVVTGTASRGGIPGVVTVVPGSSLSTVLSNAVNGTTYQLGAGTYTVTPSILNSNLTAGSQFTGITFANKTNVTILGVRGQTIIDGSSAPGELLWITNCSGINLSGLTLRGYTNHNFAIMPPYGGNLNGYLWAGVNLFKSSDILFENCNFERHFDHGLQDKGAEVSSQVAASPISTNNIVVRGCRFEDIGNVRTNNGAGGVTAGLAHSVDGAAIVCTAWTVDKCFFKNVLRGVELYDENEATGTPFFNATISGNAMQEVMDIGICTVGSTNAQFARITDNEIFNPRTWSFHGTNMGVGGTYGNYGIQINAGRGFFVSRNKVRGVFYAAFLFSNTSTFLDDFQLFYNIAIDIVDTTGSTGIGYLIGDNANSAASASAVRRMTFMGNSAVNCTGNGFLIFSGRDSTFNNNTGYRPTAYGVGSLVPGFKIGQSGSTLARMTNASFTGNVMIDGGVGADYGFVIEDNMQNIIFENNQSIGFGLNGGVTNKSGSAVAVNGPIRSFSALLDFGVIGTAASQTLTISAPGVSTNDVSTVVVNNLFDTGATSQVVPVSWCSNAVVYVRLVNNDIAGTVDFSSTRVVANVTAARIQGQ